MWSTTRHQSQPSSCRRSVIRPNHSLEAAHGLSSDTNASLEAAGGLSSDTNHSLKAAHGLSSDTNASLEAAGGLSSDTNHSLKAAHGLSSDTNASLEAAGGLPSDTNHSFEAEVVCHQTPITALMMKAVCHQTPITALKLHVVYHQTPITLITALKLHTVYHQTPMPALKLQVTPITSATNHSESINCAQLPRSPHNWPLEPHPLSCWGDLILQLFVWPHQVAHHLSNPPDGGISVESHQTRSKVFWDGQRHEVGAWVQAVHDRQLNHSGRLHLISGGWGDKEGMVTTSACKGADRLQWEIVHNREAESLWLFPSDLWRLGR